MLEVLLLALSLAHGGLAQLRYSVQEEKERGTLVANIAEDLGLDVTKLHARRFQTVPSSRTPYLEVNVENGALLVGARTDREEICRQSAQQQQPCLLHLEVFLENPLELFRVEVEVLDINDNAPAFPSSDIVVEITESATPGTRFPLESAADPDVGTNALSNYAITANEYFKLDVQTQGDGNLFAELVLEKPLDRERQAVHRYVLTAVDGGQPQRTGTALLVVRVLDSNDNAPVFDQPVYTVNLREDSAPGTLVIQLNATDVDEGTNGEVVYSLSSHNLPSVQQLFAVDAQSGRVEVAGAVDYEESNTHQIYVQARDMGPNAVPAHCKVLVKVVDMNDNAPEVSFSTVSEAVSESSAPGTVVAMLSVSDKDSGENGQVSCELLGDDAAPFKLKPSFRNYYTVVTDGQLDREVADSYTLTVVARDGGTPPLSTSKSVRVRVSDENDNAPRFTQPAYDVHVSENNVPGAYIYAVSALDPDLGANARVTYAIEEREIQGMSVLTYVSVNSDNGYLYALRSFDYEQIREFSFIVSARDSGDERQLADNATVRVVVVDQNDNVPSIIAPAAQNGTALERLPRTAEPGYLVTRVIATDADDGENARLSYSIIHGNELGMFRMDWRTGELRTARRVVSKKRDPTQRPYELLVEVRDHGQPPLSASATISVVLVDAVAGGASGRAEKGGHGGHSGHGEGTLDLTLILIVALGSVSFVFLLAMIVLAVRCRKDKKLGARSCLARGSEEWCMCCACCTCCGLGGSGVGGVGGVGAGARRSRKKKKLSKSDIMLVQSAAGQGGNVHAQVPVEESGSFGARHLHRSAQNYCYQVCLTPESASTELMFLKPGGGTDGAVGASFAEQQQQQPDIISNGSILSSETKHQRTELSYLDRPRRVNSSAFQEADIVSSKDSGHGDSEQGDSDHDATNRGHSTGADLFSNCTEECKALGHSDRCWMPSFVPGDGRQGGDYRSNLHVPGMDAVPDTEVQAGVSPGMLGDDRSFSTFGKDKSHHGTLTPHDLLLPSARAPYKPAYLSRKRIS
ncbi:protocadherin-10a isoform X2 [Astyanax mexicanus]|uniref:protocadherin-10a isoform X2 n=1 Tax=Astyanax mexicanus TaxID=7994 RepID=UPI0020CAE6AD|nr:protocadherin-10a isoform X2 [Astyanax mexicanus]